MTVIKQIHIFLCDGLTKFLSIPYILCLLAALTDYSIDFNQHTGIDP